jgi:hypothetical protein
MTSISSGSTTTIVVVVVVDVVVVVVVVVVSNDPHAGTVMSTAHTTQSLFMGIILSRNCTFTEVLLLGTELKA